MSLKKSITKQVLVLNLLIFSSNILCAQMYFTKSGSAFFKAKISLNSYTGKSNELQGNIDFETGLLEFSLPVKSIKTGKTKRDKHMYELLKAEENRDVIFKGKLFDDFDPVMKTKQILLVKGDFTLAGVTREVTIRINLKPEENGLRLSAFWSLLITEYNLKRPRMFFLKVNDKHELGVNMLLVKK